MSPDRIHSVCALVPAQYHSAPAAYDTVLKHLNSAFTVLFSMECILKILAFGLVVRSTLIECNAM